MSRIGKIPVVIPAGVEVGQDRNEITVKGPKGTLTLTVPPRVSIEREDGAMVVHRHGEDKQAKAYHGLVQRMLRNMVLGVTEGFKKELEIQGVGYRAAMDGGKLTMQLGFSHPIIFIPPPGIQIETPKPTSVVVSGFDKQQVGQAAANIRGFRPPEPYKGKGVRYLGEVVRRKVGKTGAK
jgi:large subunit ribosomal protein L6